MKHCWHPTGESFTTMRAGSDSLRCCWCGTNGHQSYEIENALTSGHGQYYIKHMKVRRPVEGESEECTAPRENQKKGES